MKSDYYCDTNSKNALEGAKYVCFIQGPINSISPNETLQLYKSIVRELKIANKSTNREQPLC